MQPVLVRPATGNARSNEHSDAAAYELVAGERRWRAARLAGLAEIPAIVVSLSNEEAASWGIVENVQREDLNAMDRAFGLKSLAEQFGLSQTEIAQRIGMERPTVANLIRLTELEPEIQRLIESGSLSAGHGRALLMAPAGAPRVTLANRCADAGWSVRKTEERAKIVGKAGLSAAESAAMKQGAALSETDRASAARRDAAVRDIERRLAEHLGTRVRIRTDDSGKRGSIGIEFYDLDQFDGLLARMGLKPE